MIAIPMLKYWLFIQQKTYNHGTNLAYTENKWKFILYDVAEALDPSHGNIVNGQLDCVDKN